MVKVIGFHGPYGSGKDTLGALLADCITGSHIVKFADPMYDLAAKLDPVFSPNMTHADKMGYLLDDERLGTRRNFMERLGTDFGRDLIHPEFWTIQTAKHIDNIFWCEPFATVIITDVRAENEAALVRNRGGIVVVLKPDWILSGQTGHKITQELNPHDTDIVLKLIEGKPLEALKELKYELGRRVV